MSKTSVPFSGPVLSVKPNRTKYKRRDIVTVVNGTLMDEQGVIYSDIPSFVADAEPTVFVTLDPSWLLAELEGAFKDTPPILVTKRDGTEEWVHPWQFKLIRTGDREETGRVERVRLDRFGVRMDGKRRQAMNVVWSPADMSPSGNLDFLLEASHGELMRWACDLRAFHKEQDIMLSSTFAGVASKLLRDERFYPDDRRRVPKATNEHAREYLPGVHQEARTEYGKDYGRVVALDQRRAYHTIAQEVDTPDPNTLYARGYFNAPLADDTPYWCTPGDGLYEKVTAQPGLLFIGAFNHQDGKNMPFRPPAMDFYGYKRLAVWSNELATMVRLGLQVEGVTAALTSTLPDTGLSKYGAWALRQIDAADDTRAAWLKPTLHNAYGLLGARPRRIRMGYRHARGGVTMDYILGARPFTVKHVETSNQLAPPTTNVVMLGVLQAEVRLRTINLANELRDHGVDVTHIHADGLHVIGQLPLSVDASRWSAKPMHNLRYVDRVSWTSDDGDCMPGRPRHAIPERKHLLNVLLSQGHRISLRPARRQRGHPDDPQCEAENAKGS